jgi:hypothetical protein
MIRTKPIQNVKHKKIKKTFLMSKMHLKIFCHFSGPFWQWRLQQFFRPFLAMAITAAAVEKIFWQTVFLF